MNSSVRAAGSTLLLVALAAPGFAATPQEIEAAVKKGAAFLDQRYRDGAPAGRRGDDGHGIGPAALAGLALLETGADPTGPAVRAITAAVRDAAYTEVRTYQIALCLLYL